jgi:hypothetical protein
MAFNANDPDHMARLLALQGYARDEIEDALLQEFPAASKDERRDIATSAIAFASDKHGALDAEVARHERAVAAEHNPDQSMHDPKEGT